MRVEQRSLSNVIAFLGPRVPLYLLLGVAVGLSLSIVEFGFVAALQGFLVALGILNTEVATLPGFLRDATPAWACLILILAVVARASLQGLQTYITALAFERQKQYQRGRLVHWALHASSVNSADVMNRYNEQIMAVSNVMNQVQTLSIQLTLAGLLWIGLLSIAAIPTLIATAVMGVFTVLIRGLDKPIQKAGKDVTAESKAILSLVLRNIRNLLLVQIYNTQGRENAVVQQGLLRFQSTIMHYHRALALKNMLPQIFGISLACGLLLFLKMESTVTSTFLISYLYLFSRYVQSFAEVGRGASQLRFLMPQFRLMLDWWNETKSNDALEAQSKSISVTDADGHQTLDQAIGWEVKDVSFAYPESPAAVLSHLSFYLTPGQALVVTGASGAGKSTLIHLLLGLIRPTQGRIDLVWQDGRRSGLDSMREELLNSVGYVGPESFVIDGTIAENLAYGLHMTPSDGALREALFLADAGFVFDLPKGLRHPISEQGHGLSAGQKQRLSLARALLRDPKVLILDEATSNLDDETEEKLVHVFQGLKAKVTLVVVTHRQALLVLADQRLKLSASAEPKLETFASDGSSKEMVDPIRL